MRHQMFNQKHLSGICGQAKSQVVLHCMSRFHLILNVVTVGLTLVVFWLLTCSLGHNSPRQNQATVPSLSMNLQQVNCLLRNV